jgi:hypothetical protein
MAVMDGMIAPSFLELYHHFLLWWSLAWNRMIQHLFHGPRVPGDYNQLVEDNAIYISW